jgi:arginase
MQDQFILAPYFMDDALPSYRALAGEGWQINAPTVRGTGMLDRLSSLHRPLADRVAIAARAGKRPVIIGGDCCNSIPMLAGLQRAGIDPALVWLDAHGDFNTFETSPSGYVFGMPLAMLCGLGDQQLIRALSMTKLPFGQVVLGDGRDLDPGERDLIKKHKIAWAREIGKVFIPLATALINRPIWVHFDTDVLDPPNLPTESPSTLYRVPDGPGMPTMHDVMHGLAQTGRIAAVSMSVALGTDTTDVWQTPAFQLLKNLLDDSPAVPNPSQSIAKDYGDDEDSAIE